MDESALSRAAGESAVVSVPVARRVPRVGLGLFSALALLLLLVSCQPSGQQPSGILDLTIAGGDVQLVVGESLTLAAELQMDRPGDETVLWTSSSETVATVDSLGLVNAVSSGTALIKYRPG